MEKSGSKIVVIEDPKMARGITGLMASRLLKKYGVPSLVIADVGDRQRLDPFSGRIQQP
jgi:single-stranded-DNA-specific exonuclease